MLGYIKLHCDVFGFVVAFWACVFMWGGIFYPSFIIMIIILNTGSVPFSAITKHSSFGMFACFFYF